MRAVITTGREKPEQHEPAARALCDRFGLTFSPRAGRRAGQVLVDAGAELLGIVGPRGLVLHKGDVELAFSAGMAELRIKRVQAGEHEPLVALAELRPGDVVLDATLGLARDALVMSAAGASVEGLEAVPLLAAFAEAGLRTVGGAAGEVAPRVQVRGAGHSDILADAPERSVDVVYFDPMFSDAVQMPPEYQLFRTLADPRPLLREQVLQALRICRRAVIIKDGPSARLVKGLGLPLRALTFGTRVRYGRFEP
jgi:16S rRNA (guanine1516-N2)-methyltransferase